MGESQKTVVAVGGHIGDVALTCGGILATLSLQGYKIITVALTGKKKRIGSSWTKIVLHMLVISTL